MADEEAVVVAVDAEVGVVAIGDGGELLWCEGKDAFGLGGPVWGAAEETVADSAAPDSATPVTRRVRLRVRSQA